VPHISLVFREMWDTAVLTLKPVSCPTALYGWEGEPVKRFWR
jgi:hypothetical protein